SSDYGADKLPPVEVVVGRPLPAVEQRMQFAWDRYLLVDRVTGRTRKPFVTTEIVLPLPEPPKRS
ncbi:MAG TPA: hypothetical protein DCQ64_11615, partial [Candidatus Rokubacteria bacterium]|nr:hypothetical protein [Candidatus Rokubacteria bacterium]